MSEPPESSSGPDLTIGTPVESLADGVPLLGRVGSHAIILVRHAGGLSAIGATCSHYGGPLAEGLVVDGTVRCPWHTGHGSRADGARRAVILGASFIGLEVAASLRARKIGVVFHLGRPASGVDRGGVVIEGGERGSS